MKQLDENYLFIPPGVRYCNRLPANAKLLFGIVANRAKDEGKAIFGYDELAQMFNSSKKSIYFWINALEEEGFLISKMLRRRKVHYRAFIILITAGEEPHLKIIK